MLRKRLVAAVLALSAGLACTGPGTNEPTVDTWKIVFANQQTSSYGGPDCPGLNDLYCKTWRDSAFSYGATLRRTGIKWELDSPTKGGVYRADSSLTIADSTRIGLTYSTSSCGAYYLTLYALSDSITGRFSWATDCHGGGDRGTFTGHR
jgi:hypothetical protein